MSTTNKLAAVAHEWLSNETNVDKSMWIWVSNREDGVDLARRMHKLYAGDHASTNVPYDTLPTYAANAATNNRVFIVSQPDHAEACLITMQPGESETRSRIATPGEQYYYQNLGGDKLTEQIDHVVSVDQKIDAKSFRVQAPDFLVVDIEEPYWDTLVRFVRPTTEVICSDRVKVKPPRK